MMKSMHVNKCTGCGACATVCPKGCIEMVADKEGFLYPKVQAANCVQCGACEKVCHYRKTMATKAVTNVYGALHKEEGVRLQSSSGGAFYALAKEVMNRGGVVFGAGFDEDFSVRHMAVETEADLPKLMGSKYVQSKIGDAYVQARAALKAGRMVLFTGTPCQIKGLHAFLGKDDENLVTMDFICHGVPSPLVWKKYLEEIREKNKSNLKAVSFRAKTHGWKVFSMQIRFENDTVHTEKLTENPYLRAFLLNIALRKTCYACTAKGIARASDITVADFWGIDKVNPALNDNKGISAVMLRGDKAERLMQTVASQFTIFKTDESVIQQTNKSITESVPYNPLRKSFFKTIKKHGFTKTFEKYCGNHLPAKIRRGAGRLLKKLRVKNG